MPPAVHPNHHPHDTHGGNAITDNDREPVTLSDVFESHLADVDPPVTVSDLLDLRATLDNTTISDPRWGPFDSLVATVPGHVRTSYLRLRFALHSHEQLSPEERAEFDRRTT